MVKLRYLQALLKHLQENPRKLYLRLPCQHVLQMVLMYQLCIFKALHHDKHNFLKFLQCHPWTFYHGIFHYNTKDESILDSNLKTNRDQNCREQPSLHAEVLIFNGRCWRFSHKWLISVSTLVMAAALESSDNSLEIITG